MPSRLLKLERQSLYYQWLDGGDSDAMFVSLKYRESETEVDRCSFAYWKVVDGLSVHKLFLRDPHRTHYHHGIPRLARNIYEIRDQVLACIRARGIKRVVIVGASQGGYMALTLAKLLEVEAPALALRCLAYDPQTQLRYDGDEPAQYRWGKIKGPSPTPELMNLQELFRQHPSRSHRQRYFIYCGTETEDVQNAQHLMGATDDPVYEKIAWKRRLVLQQCRRKHSAHGTQIVRDSERGRLRARIEAAFTSMENDIRLEPVMMRKKERGRPMASMT